MGQRPLTWQQVLCVLLIFAAIGFAALGFGANIEPSTRQVGYIGLATGAALFVVLLLWHLRSTRRPDIEPDVLATIVPPSGIIDFGKAHVASRIHQFGSMLWIEVCVQNLYSGAGKMNLVFEPQGLLRRFALDCEIPGASVIRAGAVLPLPSVTRPQQLKIDLAGTFVATGRRIRFGRRAYISKKADPVLSAMLLLVGHLHFRFGGGTCLRCEIAPAEASAPSPPPTDNWQLQLLWQPGEPLDTAEISRRMEPVELSRQGEINEAGS
jgi:hypothetical protein